MNVLGNGLSSADRDEEALSVREAELAMERRRGESEDDLLTMQGSLAMSYQALGRDEEAVLMRRDVYSGRLRLNGEENKRTILAANNYAASLVILQRHGEAKSLMHKMMPVARRVLGNSDELTLKMRQNYALTLYNADDATLEDRREAAETLEELAPTARRVLGGAHPLTMAIDEALEASRGVLSACEAATTVGDA